MKNKRTVRLSVFLGAVAILGAWAVALRVAAQSPTPISACGTYSGNLIVAQNISGGGDCITIGGNNTTLDGNGKTIAAGGYAIFNYNKSNLTVRNVVSGDALYLGGDAADNALIEDNTFSDIVVVDADDATVNHNTLGHASLGQEATNMERLTFTDNTVDGAWNKQFEVRGSGNIPCVGGHTISNNTIIDRYVCSGTCDEPMAVFLWCVANSTISNNTIYSTGDAQGIRIRDGSDNNIIANNTVRVTNVEGGIFAALNVTTGNEGVRPEPSGNVFRDNVFRADVGRALRFQGSNGNTFERNVFWGNNATQASSFEQVPQGDIFRYNTFYNSGGGPALTIDYYALTGQAMTFQNNIFATAGTRALATVKFSSAYYTGNRNLFFSSAAATVTTAGNLATWQGTYNDDLQSVFGNPIFVNAGTGDFHLQAGSAARGIGDSGTDAGAYQYDGGTPTCTESWTCGTWSSCVAGSQSRTCTDANACGTTVNRPPLTQSCSSGGDTTAPTVSITAPAAGATVNGTVTFAATASDAVGVAGVTFYVNGAALWPEDTTAPYSVQWDTTVHTNGSAKTLTALARDAANNSTTSSAVSVTIQQTPPACTENWSCGPWGVCNNGTQSRTCTDGNSCGTTNIRPPLTQSCMVSDTTAPAGVNDLRLL